MKARRSEGKKVGKGVGGDRLLVIGNRRGNPLWLPCKRKGVFYHRLEVRGLKD